jgi:DNA repair photolyase
LTFQGEEEKAMSMQKSKGNMYPWVTHTHAHLGGECPHRCVYCYVNNPRFGRPEKYKGELRLIEKEFQVKYGEGKTIFVENCNDLFANEVPEDFIRRIMAHCCEYPECAYVFQTKNPANYWKWLSSMPPKRIIGCTIETNRDMPEIGKTPSPSSRATAMNFLSPQRRFITIEPVLDFDVDILAEWIRRIDPEFVNLGADSKNRGLPEPPVEKILALVDVLKKYGIELREKHNLQRLIDNGKE